MDTIGLIAGNGILPALFADAAKAKGLRVVAVAHRGETHESLRDRVDVFEWVGLGQLDRICRVLRSNGARHAVMAGGIGRVRSFTDFRPDLGALKVVTRLRIFGDDALLRAIADYIASKGVEIVAPTDYLPEVLAPEGLLAGPAPTAGLERDIELGVKTATLLGEADVGQTVIVREGHVLALEAVEGTDEAIRRGGRLGGAGAVVVKLSKPQQDARFDLPAVGPKTLEVMAEVGARAIAVEAGRTVLLDTVELLSRAKARGITVVGVKR